MYVPVVFFKFYIIIVRSFWINNIYIIIFNLNIIVVNFLIKYFCFECT